MPERVNRESFANMRRVPAAWEDVIGSAPDEQTVEAARAMHKVVADLDNETLEAARYYSIGQIFCWTARSLSDPFYRERAIETGAEEFAEACGSPDRLERIRSQLESGQTFHFGGMDFLSRVESLAAGLSNVVIGAQQNLTNREYLAANVLLVEEQKRKGASIFVPASEKRLSDDEAELVTTEEWAGTIIGNEAMSGTTRALRAAAYDPATKSRSTVLDPARLRTMKLTPALTQFASLHIKQFLDLTPPGGAAGVLIQDETSAWRLTDTALHIKSPRGNALHTNTLRCPALHIAKMIPMVAELTLDTLEAAEQKITAMALAAA